MGERPGPVSTPPVVIGHDELFEPFAWGGPGRSRGLLVDLLATALGRAGIAHAWRPLGLDILERALYAGSIDAIAGKAVTEARRRTLDFSDPLAITGAALFALRGRPAPAHPGELAGGIVATPRGGPLAEWIGRRHPDVRVSLVASYRAALDAVMGGAATVAALNLHAGLAVAQRHYPGCFAPPGAPFLELSLALAVARGRQATLITAVNHELAALGGTDARAAIFAEWGSPGRPGDPD